MAAFPLPRYCRILDSGMSKEVAAAIRREIEARGPITFAEFMELALYTPGGFYERPPIGADGDFVTSPHVHPVFGQLVAECLKQLWAGLGRPDPLVVVEIGAGDGTLARQLMAALRDLPLDYTAVERSPGAREALGRLPVMVATELPERIDPGCVIVNEVLDNLPFRRVRSTPTGLAEVRVGLSRGRIAEVETPADGPLSELCRSLPAGREAVVPTGALSLVDRLTGMLARGYAVLIDYATSSGPTAEQVHGYRKHRIVEDLMDDPGSADITAGVDFPLLARRAASNGFASLGTVGQRAALLALGFAAWTEGERERQTSHLQHGSGLDAVRTWGGRSRATLLVDLLGLGRLTWWILATPGLPPPPWLLSARSEEAARAGPGLGAPAAT